ncbi:cytochrome p450 704c1 [Phtheirospermum japonicum]|uniref:Cytochrome p450 704c1 n=1 Tax=Phtheirospermum japonicum TaxID=374723 RepID=A0A830BLV6_9LAMI|nr:cytochrome p450 704c1 [Phtheirospermum japonicum]
MAIIFIFIIIIFVVSAQLLARKLYEKQGKKKYHPIGGTVVHQLLNFNRLHDYMTELARKYKTYRLISPFRSEVYTSDPANVEYILKTNFDNYGKGDYNYSILKDLLGDGVFTVDGDKWREQRKVSSYEFSTRVLRDFNSIFRVAFGVELDTMCGSNEEGAKFSNAFDDASEMTAWRYVDILWRIKRALGFGSEAKLKKNLKVVDEFVYKLISSKTENMHRSHDDPSVGSSRRAAV